MALITAPQLVTLRTPGQWSEPYLAIYKPNVIYTARLDDVPTSTDRVSEVTYVSGSGTLGDIVADMTMLVGSSAGARDLGTVRIRKAADGTKFYFGEVSDVQWAADAYLTVIDDFSLRVKPAKLVGAAMKMDVDVAYSDQHTDFDPMPAMGPHAVAWLQTVVTPAYDETVLADDASIVYSAGWTLYGSPPPIHKYSNTTSAQAVLTFTGERIRLYCLTASNQGEAEIYLDSVLVDTWDNYSAGAVENVLAYDSGTIADEEHEIKVVVKGTKNPASSGYYVSLMKFVYTVAEVSVTDVDVEFDAGDSWVIGSTISAYAWSAPGASATADMATSTPTLTYNAAGMYRVYCTVTAANGKSFTGVRHVFVYSTSTMPVTNFQLKASPAGDYDSGGWNFSITLYDEAAQADVQDRALVVLFAKDWYGETETSIGPIANRENIVAMGWIAGETIRWDVETGSVDFSVEGPQYWLKAEPSTALTLKFKVGTAAAWNQMPQLSVDRGLWHLLHYRSNVTRIMDVFLTDDVLYAPDFTLGESSLWSQLEAVAGRIFAKPCCNRFGQMYTKVDIQMFPVLDRSGAVVEVMTITDQDRENGITPQRVLVSQSAMFSMSSMQVGDSGRSYSLYSLSPGHDHKSFGNPDQGENYLVSDQEAANTLCGMKVGKDNNEYPDISIRMAQNNRFLDICPPQFLALTMPTTDSPREITFAKNIIPRWVELEWDSANNIFSTNFSAEAETFAENAVNGDVPTDDISTPPTPPPPPPPPGDETDPAGPHNVLIATSNFGLMYTINFHEDSPDWFFMNAGLPTEGVNFVRRIKRCPSGLLLVGMGTTSFTNLYRHLYMAIGLGGTWSLLADHSTVDQGAYGNPGICAFGVNENSSEDILMVGGGFAALNEGTKKVYRGTRAGLSLVDGDIDIEDEIGDVSYGLAKWLMTANRAAALSPGGWSLMSAAGAIETAAEDYTTPFLHASRKYHRRAGSIVFAIEDSDGDYLRIISDNDPTVENLVNIELGYEYASAFDVSPDGVFLMGGVGTAIGQRSSDGGATWGNVGTTGGMTVGFNRWANGGNTLQWVSATTQKVMLTLDWGDTWIDKTGNLSTLAPLAAITDILVLPT